MSFNFGGTSLFPSTSTPSLGFNASNANKPTAFGTSFFNTTSTAPAFGLGANTPTSTAFSGFGATQPSTGFGATQPSTGFGATQPSTGFGLTCFGPTTSTTSTSLGGFGGFGAPAATTATTGFAGGLGGFGSTSTSGTTGTGLFSGFGQTNQTSSVGTGLGGFGSSFGTKPTTSLGWGGTTFGQQTTTQPAFGQPQPFQQQQQQQPIDPHQALYNSVFNCQVFGDERDRTLSRWNLVQALWGTGKGYYSQQAPPVEYDLKNPLCRFKAMSYSLRPRSENKDGLVALVFNKKESEIRTLESQLTTNLFNILGNKPNLAPRIESIKPFSDVKSVVIIFVEEKSVTGTVRKIPASELSNYFMQPMQRQQLTNLQIENVYPQVDPGQEQLKEYLDNPPPGFDARLWKQAQDDNPMPDRLIPVPLIGFADVRWRMKCQEQETALHQAFLDKMAEEITDLQRKHTETLAKISEYRLRFSELQHRILKVMIVQEISRKMGLSLLPEEEKLKSRLETISATVNSAPFKSRLAKLTEAVKSHSLSNKEPQRYKMDADVIAEIKQFLTMEQSGMTHVIDTIHSDLGDLKRIKDGMTRILQGNM